MVLIRRMTHALAAFVLAISPASGALAADGAIPASPPSPSTAVAASAAATAVSGKKAVTRDGWPRLLYSRDPHLHQALQKKVRAMGLGRYAADRKLAVALVDITEPTRPRVATVNAHEMMYAASLPKIAILLGAYQKAQDGGLVGHESLQDAPDDR